MIRLNMELYPQSLKLWNFLNNLIKKYLINLNYRLVNIQATVLLKLVKNIKCHWVVVDI